MRILVATLTLVLLAGPAYAQNMGGGMGGKGGRKGRNSSPQNTEQQKADQQKRRPLTTLTRWAKNDP